jgi:membrane-associated phospholipid phosphatase
VVATLCALRFWRPLGLALAPLTAGMVFAVVYGQFHYASDALAGLAVAVVVLTSLNAGAARVRAVSLAPAAETAADSTPL